MRFTPAYLLPSAGLFPSAPNDVFGGGRSWGSYPTSKLSKSRNDAFGVERTFVARHDRPIGGGPIEAACRSIVKSPWVESVCDGAVAEGDIFSASAPM